MAINKYVCIVHKYMQFNKQSSHLIYSDVKDYEIQFLKIWSSDKHFQPELLLGDVFLCHDKNYVYQALRFYEPTPKQF